VTAVSRAQDSSLETLIKDEARRLGFVLAGVTTPDPPQHLSVFEAWIRGGRHGSMRYLSGERSLVCRADPLQLMPACKSIIVLAAPYSNPGQLATHERGENRNQLRGKVAAYAWGQDYHNVLPERLQAIVAFIERQTGHPVSSRCFTDAAPIMERDLAQRAGLGWIGRNTCLINPKLGSYVLLSEILLDLHLTPDMPWETDRCGACTRCIDACPTDCILKDRTIDARRCISYLTIELRDTIPLELRRLTGSWIFGCDICQVVCPWNRFAPTTGDAAFAAQGDSATPPLLTQLQLSAEEFHRDFEGTAVRRTKHAGYLRNTAVAIGNSAGPDAIPLLRDAAQRGGPMVQEHADWAIRRIAQRGGNDE